MQLRCGIIFTLFLFATYGLGQVLTMRPPEGLSVAPSASTVLNTAILLVVPAGTPLRVALDGEVHIHKVGQRIHGDVTEPVYAFDKLVIPAGSEVLGKVVAIEDVPKKVRTFAALNGNLAPAHQVRIEFDELQLFGGRSMRLKTTVSPASAAVLEFVAAGGNTNITKSGAAKNAVTRKIREAKQEAKREWDDVNSQLRQPGKMHRLQRYAVAQLPWHPQYLESGTSFNAELQEPLNFGIETLPPESLSTIGTQPPSGSLVHARLVTSLDSGTAKQGDPVEAVITQPLIASEHIILPEGSRLKGTVLQARAARRLSRNGQLRIVFHQVVPPSGVEQQLQASLEGLSVAKDEHLALDSEGGAQVTNPKARYLTTGISIALAASSLHTEHEHGAVENGGNATGGALNGASGFRLIGTLLGTFAHSRAVSSSLGFYGAGMSAYSHFLARGRDVVYPKDMTMIIGLGTRDAKPEASAPAASPSR